MESDIQLRLSRLNLLYHSIITDKYIAGYEQQLKHLVKQLKGWGYKFRMGKIEIDFTRYGLNDLEFKLYSRWNIVRMEKRFGEDNQLPMYSQFMYDCEKYLYREIFSSLLERKIVGETFFQLENNAGDYIEFMQSGHLIDAYILF